MTDDSNARYRPDDHSGRTPGHGGSGNDPLAELARLIGQNDPFSELGRLSRSAAAREPYYGDAQASQHDPYYAGEASTSRDWHGSPAPAAGYEAPAAGYESSAPDAYSQSPAAPEPHPETHSYSADPHTQTYSEFSADDYRRAGDHAASRYDLPASGQMAAYAAADAPPAADSHQPEAIGPLPAMLRSEDFDEEPPRSRGRRWLSTLAAVLVFAIVGSASAFAYRLMLGGSTATLLGGATAWFGGAGKASSPPPVIRANPEPTKVAPPPSTNEPATKLSYDRFGDRSQNEQVVVREERPVDQVRASAPPPAPPPAPAAVAVVTPPPPPVSPNPPSVLTEPKRVRTVAVRPDAPDQSAQPPSPPPARRQQAAPANAPLEVSPQSAPPSAPAPTRSVAPRPAAPPSANAPLSLSPDSGPPPAPAAAARAAAAPMRVASVPAPAAQASAAGGGYLVQVSSQRSEADAQAAFRSVKSKYSSVLGDRSPVIRRADLGAKGTYYRAMVGPFATRDEAIQLCGSLKAAGGDCVVQGNQ
jgi:hypothetical protein